MNRCGIQQNAFGNREETMRSSLAVSVSDRRETMVCPKPRRIGVFNPSMNDHPVRSLIWQLSHPVELCESNSGGDLLDIILTKGGGSGVEQACPETMIASPPSPIFSGSPPSRVSNPLTQDSRFGDELFFSPPPLIPPRATPLPSSPSSTRKGGCVRANFGNNPGVRIEGFDCLDRDRRNRSIPALA